MLRRNGANQVNVRKTKVDTSEGMKLSMKMKDQSSMNNDRATLYSVMI